MAALLHLSSLLLILLIPASYALASPKPTASNLPTSSVTEDIAVVGCGVLGTSLCQQLLSDPRFAGRTVTGITKSRARHESIREQVHASVPDAAERFAVLTLEEALARYDGRPCRDVVFSVPPSGCDDYPAAVRDAASRLWAGEDEGGTFVFTSSGGVYEGADGETVTEGSPACDPAEHPRQGRLLAAEEEARAAGGCALRLAGLYLLDRGAHFYWLERCGETGVAGRADGLVNLVHYDDAAGACRAALKAGPGVVPRRTFLVSDGSVTTRRGICESARKHPRYAGLAMPAFRGPADGPRGKVYDGSQSNAALGWTPTYASFDAFMIESAKEEQLSDE